MCGCVVLATVRVYQGEGQQAVERSKAMLDPTATQVDYDEYRTQVAWVNEHDWQFEKPVKRHPVRQAVAKALIALAHALTPETERETQTA
jgi:hypothetical protein